MRFAAYTGTSMVLATGVIIRALHQRANFYSACVYLAQSNACLMILTNLVLLGVCGVMLGLQKVLYGPLRPIEIEQLYEKAWFAITETCLAMTIFREELGGWFVVMFVSLLIGKVWGWIGDGRLEILEQQPPVNPRLFHARLSTSLILSIIFEIYMLRYSVQTVRQQARPNMMVMFAFEFAVLAITSISAFARYTISLYEAAVIKKQTALRLEERRQQIRQEREQLASAERQTSENQESTDLAVDDVLEELDIDVPGWEEKGRWVFYLDLATDFIKLILYLTFFSVLCMFYGMPIHIIRDVALTIRSFYKRITDFVRYRHATRDMNERYPDATPEEIQNEDVCIICREGMQAWSSAGEQRGTTGDGSTPPVDSHRATDERLRPKKLPCGHILHFACLRSWLERQQNCPTCRRAVLVATPTTRPQAPQTANRAGQGNGQANAGNVNAGNVNNNQRGAAERNRIRVFNFGPFRVGFGAGQDIHGLAQQLNNQPHPEPQQAPGAPGRMTPQIGFGLRFGRQPPATNPADISRLAQHGVQTQLHAVEQQLMQDINSLRVQADQLYLVRALQGELARLRIVQAHANTSQNGVMNGSSAPNANGIFLSQPPLRPVVHTFNVNEQQGTLDTRSQDLPTGLTIPDGWTLLPLHRIANHTTVHQQPANQQPVNSSDSIIGATRDDGSNRNQQQPNILANVPTSSSRQRPTSDSPSGTPIPHNLRDAPENIMVPVPSNSSPINPPEATIALESTAQEHTRSPASRTTVYDAGIGPHLEGHGSPREGEKSVPIPQWGSNSVEGKVPGPQSKTPSSSNMDSNWEDDVDQSESSAERRAAKGKGKATTIEDAVEDVD